MNWISYAFGQNHFEIDPDLPYILQHYWPQYAEHRGELVQFGAFTGRDAYEVGYHIDHDAPPVLVSHDLDGRRVDRVRLSPAEMNLLPRLTEILRPPYEGGSWHHHFALGYLLADPGLYCILTITGQTAYALYKYAPEHNLVTRSLLSGELWGATWMTETQGGNDLGANRASAQHDPDGWHIKGGDKYFASGAGLADFAIVTARPHGAPAGPKGLSLFLIPRLNRQGDLNFKVRRLKNKSATRAVPTGEVELEGSEAFLVGRPEHGIYYTLETLTVSRIANAVASMGISQKAIIEARERVRRRQAFGRCIEDHPLVRRDLTECALRQAGGLALAFHAVDLFDRAWHETPPYTSHYHHARLMTHLAKNRTAEHAGRVTALAMELFGGLGFLEEYAVARWHREALITPIWEGTSNIQALELIETIHKKNAHEPFLDQLRHSLTEAGTPEAQTAYKVAETTLKQLGAESGDTATWYGKATLTRLADAASVACLYDLAQHQERYAKLAVLYTRYFLENQELPVWAMHDRSIWDPANRT
ncbi:MAG: acyl-CoA dehydrogenase family protein [Gammaproteobacteria bacterium]